MNIVEYINEKISMLHKEFKIRLSAQERAHFNELKTEIAVDNYVHSIIMNKL